MNEKIELITSNHIDFLNFLRTKFPLFHLSNVFFRDIHYGVRFYLENKGKKANYQEAEHIAKAVAEYLEQQKILRKLDHQTWVVNYPNFKVKKAS